jgi:hypothetical protein
METLKVKEATVQYKRHFSKGTDSKQRLPEKTNHSFGEAGS